MIRATSGLVLGFVAAMGLLAGAAALHESLANRRYALLERHSALMAGMGDLRARANDVRGPRAVRVWAEARGMVPAPENGDVLVVAPDEAPRPTPNPTTGLEVRTIWR